MFPCPPKVKSIGNQYAFPHGSYDYGLTKREWFIGMAMQGMLAADWNIDVIPRSSVQIADELIEKLQEKSDDTVAIR